MTAPRIGVRPRPPPTTHRPTDPSEHRDDYPQDHVGVEDHEPHSGDYEGDAAYRGDFHRWLAEIWTFKDAQIESLLRPGSNT